MYCDWCEGGANDLVYGGENIVTADVDEDTGFLTVYLNGEEVASRHVKYCPMCGRRIGIPRTKIPNELREEFYKNREKAFELACKKVGMANWYETLDWVDRDYYIDCLEQKAGY